MKVTSALLSLAGIAGLASATDVPNLGNGMYTVPLVNGTLDFANAIKDPWDINNNNESQQQQRKRTTAPLAPGVCDAQFPTRRTICRARTFPREDYLRAYAKYLDWIETGPDEGWLPSRSCKTLLWGAAGVTACSTGGRNPTCRDELAEAMRELDLYCDLDQGGDIYIKRWLKRYSRHHVRDGPETSINGPGGGNPATAAVVKTLDIYAGGDGHGELGFPPAQE
ncbi:hypothetical protein M426DRAFT_13593 [Hypoxylon sp. CI-4A]|nr:hypothetical protein M426DRAFT_13593 [Hypoxylon sp. CI-4A]